MGLALDLSLLIPLATGSPSCCFRIHWHRVRTSQPQWQVSLVLPPDDISLYLPFLHFLIPQVSSFKLHTKHIFLFQDSPGFQILLALNVTLHLFQYKIWVAFNSITVRFIKWSPFNIYLEISLKHLQQCEQLWGSRFGWILLLKHLWLSHLDSSFLGQTQKAALKMLFDVGFGRCPLGFQKSFL